MMNYVFVLFEKEILELKSGDPLGTKRLVLCQKIGEYLCISMF